MTILPLYAAPQYAPQVTDWLWQAFGDETLPRQFFASIVQHSQTAEALPLTFIAVEGEQLLGTIGLWRCDLISRQDLFPWLAALFVAPAARGQGLAGKTAAACDRLCPPRGLSGALSLLRLPGFL
ncbi:acetyltransferase, (GNAT) family [Klebsiella pneumoniae]|nr:acetyltransferase, (GNAT) family [Klebsiella pneumoniae]